LSAPRRRDGIKGFKDLQTVRPYDSRAVPRVSRDFYSRFRFRL